QIAPTGLIRIGGSNDGIHQTLTNKGKGVGIAIIDTGLNFAHLDLPVVNSESRYNCDERANDVDDHEGHGTEVAGVIAALDDYKGIVGVAPASTLYIVKY